MMNPSPASDLRRRLTGSLALLRLSLALLFLLWAVGKLVHPEGNAAIWKHFYGVPIGVRVSIPIGIVEIAFALALAAGLWRRWTYGLACLLHGVSVVSSWKQLLHPFGSPGHLFIAGVPALAGLVALYLLREYDLWTVDAWRGNVRSFGEAAASG